MRSKEVGIEVLLYEAFLGRWLLSTAASSRGGKRDGRVVFFFVFASFLKFGPIFFGMEAKNGEDALQARRHGLMKEGRKDGDWSDRPCS